MVLMAMPSAENGCAGTGQQLEVLRSLLVFPSFFPVLSPFLPFFPLVESVKMHYVDNNDVSEQLDHVKKLFAKKLLVFV